MGGDSLANSSHAMNILLLGPRGVGKTTWVNAALNYCKHGSLGEALSADEVTYAAPSIFYAKEEANAGSARVAVGFADASYLNDASEAPGTGVEEFFTQKTIVHSFTFGTSVIRFIDTPGTGNPGDVERDDEVFDDIIQTLRNYSQLHGVVIFVEPTWTALQSKIDLHSILSRLSPDVAENIVFAFTNTSATSYLSGSSFFPLRACLNDYGVPGLELTRGRVFCFDSEGFRYLVANKQGHILGNRSDVQYSWDHSSEEMRRMIDYFSLVKPHKIDKTLNLVGARRAVLHITKALAEARTTRRWHLTITEELRENQKQSQMSVKTLQGKLKVTKAMLQSKPLDEPCVVCKHADCVEYVDDGSGDATVIPRYKSHCCDGVYLDGVQADTIGHPGLIDCPAFNGGDTCIKCGHHWSQHLHMLYELEEVTTETIDLEVKRLLEEANRDLRLEQEAVAEIEQRSLEWKEDRLIVENFQTQLEAFVQRNSFFARREERSSRHMVDALLGDDPGINSLVDSWNKLKHMHDILGVQIQDLFVNPKGLIEKVHDIRSR